MKCLYWLPALFLLAACGGSEPQTPPPPPPVAQGFSIDAPESVVYGATFSISVTSKTDSAVSISSIDTDVPLKQLESEVDNSFSFIAPALSLAPESFTLTLTDSQSNTETVTIAVQDDTDTSKLVDLSRPYPFSNSNTEKFDHYRYDEAGIPMFFDHTNTWVYFPIQISQVAQTYYARLRSGNYTAEQESRFIAMAEWLRDQCKSVETYAFCSWQGEFDVPAYRMPDNWTSAMAQGQSISVMISAYAWTKDESYLDVAKDAIVAFSYPIEEKGVVADYDGVPWYEEYGSETDPAHVLNGFLFSLAGLYDAYELMGSATAKALFDQGVESLEQRIERFDMGFGSYYDDSFLNQIAITKGQVGDHYHELHILQLAWVYQRSQSDVILDAVKRFLQYDTGGLYTMGPVYDISKKINDIIPSHTIAPSTHGKDLLFDSNWTWKRYWSSNRSTQRLDVQLNNQNADNAPIEVDALRLTGVVESDIPANIDVYSCSGEQRILIQAGINQADNQTTGFDYNLDGYDTFTSVLSFDTPLELPCDNVELVMTPQRDDGLIRLRELNIHMRQPTVLNAILALYE
ncbi:hypothetical protein CWE22_05665 [Pseudidiomarina aestuarii]|uniref:D-glucuronyl C5-epimerase C-terminal domain-containing protein n=1 Tax=Pseudidiomarina aestuarii TaxID=624146 RepID=A0A7Z6ZUP4_9GAMM|nr:D-glucuronyl C5-epimerase family protein [Pseudidiomarina aestuarii]RUO41643.1 hypothetical protein CWE22_05665 [Pseudidiomarina aestuarii]